MDLVFLTTSLERGGAETQLVRIAATLKRRGWKVGIITLLPSDGLREEVEKAAIPWVECPGLPARVPLKPAFRLIRQLRSWRPPLLITFNYPADVMGRVCGRLAGVPTILSGLRTAQAQPPLREAFYRFTEPLIAMTVSNSHAALARMLARGTLTPSKTAMINNGLNLDAYPDPMTRQEARALLGLRDGEFAWAAVGNLRKAKDYPTLLEACAMIRSEGSGFRLLIIGEGPDRGDLEAMADSLGLADRIAFLGSRRDVPRILKAVDGYVLSSAWEGSPNTLMEAMASGLPSVATDVGDVRVLVEKADSGFVVPPGDPAALADRMLALMALDDSTRQWMGAHGRDLILAEFENERVVDVWEALLGRLAPGVSPAEGRAIRA